MKDQDEMFERATETPAFLGCPQHMPTHLPGGFDGVEPAEKDVHGLHGFASEFNRFSRRVKRHLQELCKQVNETMADAFSTYVKPQPPKNQAAAFTPHGVGWWLSYAEALCGDYGWSWQEVLAMPLATVFALACAHRERHGVEHGGPDYVERKFIKEHLHV